MSSTTRWSLTWALTVVDWDSLYVYAYVVAADADVVVAVVVRVAERDCERWLKIWEVHLGWKIYRVTQSECRPMWILWMLTTNWMMISVFVVVVAVVVVAADAVVWQNAWQRTQQNTNEAPSPSLNHKLLQWDLFCIWAYKNDTRICVVYCVLPIKTADAALEALLCLLRMRRLLLTSAEVVSFWFCSFS